MKKLIFLSFFLILNLSLFCQIDTVYSENGRVRFISDVQNGIKVRGFFIKVCG